jgi:hypothetical protein
MPDVDVLDSDKEPRVDRDCFRARKSMRGSGGVYPDSTRCPILLPAKFQSHAAPELHVKFGSQFATGVQR